MNYLVANWKSNKTLAEVKIWFESLNLTRVDPEQIQLIVCPPAPFLLDVADSIHRQKLPIKLGIQDISPFPFGAYTGAITAGMVAEWVDFAIVGHSERRRYFSESNQDVDKKISEALKENITPIVCIDEPYLQSQLQTIEKSNHTKIMVAYEPVSAIGSGNPDTPKHADQIGERVKKILDNRTPVLYGGSVNQENLGYYLNQTHINGALIGGASLDPQEFSMLVNSISK